MNLTYITTKVFVCVCVFEGIVKFVQFYAVNIKCQGNDRLL